MAERRRAKSVDTGEMESAGGMRWLLTYADLITLLLAMFIILWITSKQDTVKFKAVMEGFQGIFGKQSVILTGGHSMLNGAVKGGPIPKFTPLIPLGEKMQEHAEMMEQQGQGAIESKLTEQGLEIIIRTEQGAKPLFMRGSAEISPAFKPILDNMISRLKSMGQPVRIEGHTCNLPISTAQFPSNWELSTRRATNILRYFIAKGYPKEKLSAAGYADSRPLPGYPNTTEANRKKNRRVEIIVLSSKAERLEPVAGDIEKFMKEKSKEH